MTKSKISHLILASFTALSLAACGAADHGNDGRDWISLI